MSDYESVVRGKRGFTYEVKGLDDRSLTSIRDTQDDLFAQIEYTPETGEYIVELDGGYSTWEDLKELGFIGGMNIQETEAPHFENMIGNFEREIVDEWRDVTYATLEKNGRRMELENIKEDDEKTLVRLITEEGNISKVARNIIDMLNPPAIDGENGDPYGESWAPFSESKVVRRSPETREETLEDVFDTAIGLTEDMLEKRKKSRD